MEYSFGDITVACTNTDRVVFPEVGITKGEVIAYYASVADVMLPEVRDRPLTIERFTKGVDKGGFYQKHAQKHYPAWIERIELGTKTKVNYPLCDSPAALVYFANQGGFVMHVWTSRVQAPANPDEIVFDLDPPENGFALVQQTAHLLHDLFEELSLTAFVKTTGSKGLHVVAPLDDQATFEEVHALCAGVSKLLCSRHPDLVTTEFYKKDRKGRLFLDTGRNSLGATMVAPYSLRGRPNAPVSTPIEWSEVDDVKPDGIVLGDIAKRLDTVGDPWREMREEPGSLRTAAAALIKMLDT